MFAEKVRCYDTVLLLIRVLTLCCDDFFQMDLTTFIEKNGCECLNEADGHTLAHALTSKGGYLESDCDEQVSR